MTMLWATRGREWGFKFVRNDFGGDPLLVYEEAFAGAGTDADTVHRAGDTVALRILDPEKRADRAGRIIPHEFVLAGSLAERVASVEDGLREVWPLVADEYAQLWGMSGSR